MSENPEHPEGSAPVNNGRIYDSEATADERLWAALMHLTFLLPGLSIIPLIILWLIKRNDSVFIDDHGKEALNFQISLYLWITLSSFLIFCVIGIIMLPLLGILSWVASIVNAIRANQGQYVRYPITIRFFD